MNFTTEEIKTLYKKARNYAVVYFQGDEPDSIELKPDGSIAARYEGRYGYEDETFTITSDDLSANLEEVINKREEETRREQIEYEKHQKEMRRLEDARKKTERKKQFEELKKEFGRKPRSNN